MTPAATLERVLDVLEQQRRSPVELRLLVALAGREMTVAELADRLAGRSSEEVANTARRLATAGLVRYRLSRERGETTLALTCSGLATVRPLMRLDGLRTSPA